MDRPIKFRRQMRGYNKNDVNEFITEENIRFNKIEESYVKKVKELEDEIAALRSELSQIDEHRDRIIELELSVAELNSELENKTKLINEKDAIIEGLKSTADSANERLATANSIIDNLKNSHTVAVSASSYVSDSDLDDEIIEKAEKYDAICDKVDEILNFAKTEADKIINEAYELRKQTVKKTSAQMKSDISDRSDSIIEELKRSIRRQFKK